MKICSELTEKSAKIMQPWLISFNVTLGIDSIQLTRTWVPLMSPPLLPHIVKRQVLLT